MAKRKKKAASKTTTKERKSLTLRQIKALAKGRELMKKAQKLVKASGQKTVTKRVYNMNMKDALKKVAKKGSVK